MAEQTKSFLAPEGVSRVSVQGQQFEVDSNGFIHIPFALSHHVEALGNFKPAPVRVRIKEDLSELGAELKSGVANILGRAPITSVPAPATPEPQPEGSALSRLQAKAKELNQEDGLRLALDAYGLRIGKAVSEFTEADYEGFEKAVNEANARAQAQKSE